MKESFSNKGYFPNRINSAPPDEGEPHLKTSLNLLANEFKPVGLANVLSIKPQNYQKKTLEQMQLFTSHHLNYLQIVSHLFLILVLQLLFLIALQPSQLFQIMIN